MPEITDHDWVRILPLVGITAMRNGCGGAWRVWVLARNLDTTGSKWVDTSALTARLKGLGVSDRKVRRWLGEARKTGLIRSITQHNGQSVFYLASAVQAARLLNCETVGSRQALVPAQALVKGGWRATVWSGFIATFEGRPVSRAVLRRISGVSESTQQNLENGANVRRRLNIASSEVPGERLEAVRLARHSASFVYQGKVCWRLPDIRIVDETVARSWKVGRSRKTARMLNGAKGHCAFRVERASEPSSPVRVFCRTRHELTMSLKHSEENRLDEVYAWNPALSDRVNVWDVIVKGMETDDDLPF